MTFTLWLTLGAIGFIMAAMMDRIVKTKPIDIGLFIAACLLGPIILAVSILSFILSFFDEE